MALLAPAGCSSSEPADTDAAEPIQANDPSPDIVPQTGAPPLGAPRAKVPPDSVLADGE